MKRLLSLSLFAMLTTTALGGASGCTGKPVGGPSDGEVISDESGKDDTVASSKVDAKLQPLLAFLRDDKNLVTQLGPEGTTAVAVKKKVKVVTYSDFGKAVDSAARSIANNYYVDLPNGKFRRGYGLVDLLAVGDMYVSVKAGYGEDSFVDKLVVESKREVARDLAREMLPEAALISADQASTTSTGNYVLVLGDIGSGQAIVMSIEYQIE